MRRSILIALAAAALGFLAVWFLRPAGTGAGSGETRARPAAAPEAPEAVPGDVQPARGVGAEPALGLAGDPVSPRVSVAEAPWSAVVRLRDGRPGAGAEVSWTRVEGFLPWSVWDWDEIDRAWWRFASGEIAADSAGRFAFADGPLEDPEWGSVLWISRVGQEAAFEVLAPGLQALTGREYVLAEAEPVVVRVRGAGGEPVEGAVVEQAGVSLDGASPHAVPRHVPLLFYRSAVTDGRGEARLAAFPGSQAVRARAGGKLSRPRVLARGEREAVLALAQTFVVEGTITRPVAEDLGGEITPRITFAAQEGNVWRELGTLAVRGSEVWGPLELPCAAGAVYRAQVHGVAVVTNDVLFPPPRPGQRVHLDLRAQVGTDHWFLVTDEAETPLPEARVEVTWLQDGRLQGAVGYARPDGYVSVLGIRPGTTAGSVSCPGYATQALRDIELPPPAPESTAVALARAGRLRGRVTLAGEPVQDFEVTYWPGDELLRKQSRAFTDRADGSFVLDDVPLSPLGVVAASPASPGCEPVQVSVTAEGVDVALELLPPLPGTGRIVDAETGLSIAGAAIRPQVMASAGPASGWGAPIPVAEDGTFRALAFREGKSLLFADAPDHGSRAVSALSVDGALDFGVIELEHLVDLELVLLGAEGAPAGYRFLGHGPEVVTCSRFDPGSDGSLHGWLRKISPGPYRFFLHHPDGSDEIVYADVHANTQALRFHAGGGGAVRVELKTGPPAGERTLMLEYQGLDGRAIQRAVVLGREEEHVFEGLAPGPVSVRLSEGEETLAFEDAAVVAGEVVAVVLAPAGGALAVQLVDPEEEPVANAFARLWGVGSATARLFSGVTDAEGRIRFSGLAAGDYLLSFLHATQGTLADVELSVGEEEALERTLVLDGRAALELLLQDDGVPLPGVACELVDRLGHNLHEPLITGAEGRVTLARLAPGSYGVELTGSDVWPLHLSATASAGGAPAVVQVHRLGALTLRALNASGAPVSGLDVELSFEPTGERAADWIAAGRLPGEPALATDAHGEIRLSGIPDGPYAWRIGALAGGCTVKPGGTTLVLVAVDG